MIPRLRPRTASCSLTADAVAAVKREFVDTYTAVDDHGPTRRNNDTLTCSAALGEPLTQAPDQAVGEGGSS